MNSVTAHDYAWIRTSSLLRFMMEVGYTLTLIQGRTPREVLRVMEAEPRGSGEGTAGLIEADDAHRAEVDDDWDESYVAGAFSAPGENGDWTLVLGFDGGMGGLGAVHGDAFEGLPGRGAFDQRRQAHRPLLLVRGR